MCVLVDDGECRLMLQLQRTSFWPLYPAIEWMFVRLLLTVASVASCCAGVLLPDIATGCTRTRLSDEDVRRLMLQLQVTTGMTGAVAHYVGSEIGSPRLRLK